MRSAEKLIIDNMRWAEAIAVSKYPQHYYLDDLKQAALLGLVQAADEYTPDRGSFASLARVIISRRLSDCLRESKVIKDWYYIYLGYEPATIVSVI